LCTEVLSFARPLAFRGIDYYVYKRVRDFLARRHWMKGRGTRRFSSSVVYGDPLQGKMMKRKEWEMAEQYVEQLAAARERVVADRRGLAAEVAGPYERGRHEQWRRMIEIQDTIDAIDRAITDERSIKEKGKPVSLVDLLL
jgi:hypothetical protein